MAFPLASFEKYIDPTIRKRGQDYYHEDAVQDLLELDFDCFEATVEGSELYNVSVNLHEGDIVHYECDCPYDGPICKHVVAVLYAIREEVIEDGDFPLGSSSKSQPTKGKKEPTVAEKIDQVLSTLSSDQIRDFLRSQCLEEEQVRRRFFLKFESIAHPLGKKDFQDQVKSILKIAADKHGFIDYRATRQVYGQVMEILDAAETYMETRNHDTAFAAATAVLEAMNEALQYADDSNGQIGGCVEEAIAILDDLAGKLSLPEEVRKEAMSYCIHAYTSRKFEGWDWDITMLRLAGEFARSPEEGEAVLKIAPRSETSKHTLQYQQDATMEIIRRFHGDEAAVLYMHDHISNPNFRKSLIKTAIEVRDYEHADTLASEGHEQDKNEYPGLAQDWLKIRLDIAQKTKDKESIRTHARQLLLTSHHGMEYYDLLKQQVPASEWPAYVENLLTDLQKSDKHRWAYQTLQMEIYERERMLDRLWAVIKQRPEVSLLEKYQAILTPKYKAELAQSWENILVNHLRYCNDRHSYVTACTYLRKMQSLAAHDAVATLVKFIREEHKKRPAFMDELRRAGF